MLFRHNFGTPMSGEQNVSIILAAFANAYCHNCLSPDEAERLAGSFAHVSSIRFGGVKPLPPVEAARGWMEALRQMNTRRLWLQQLTTPGPLPPAVVAAFANANPTLIFVDCERPHVMRPEWTFVEERWRITYHISPIDDLPPVGDVNVNQASDELQRQVAAARTFLTTHADPYYAYIDEHLGGAIAILEESEYRCELLPLCGYSAAAHRLLGAATASWVFGGMGSWNDMRFDDKAIQQQYVALTNTFYDAVQNGCLVAANAFAP